MRCCRWWQCQWHVAVWYSAIGSIGRTAIKNSGIWPVAIGGSANRRVAVGQLFERDLHSGSTDLYGISWRGVQVIMRIAYAPVFSISRVDVDVIDFLMGIYFRNDCISAYYIHFCVYIA